MRNLSFRYRFFPECVLSVSATPFSEVIDVREESKKMVIFQKPNNNYFGMIENELIQTFDEYSTKMEELVRELSASPIPKIGIIRLREDGKGENKLTILKRICDNYKVSMIKMPWIKFWTTRLKPLKSHVIIIKGKLKIGKTIKDKRHVLFCMETAKKSNSDTLLQGLMNIFAEFLIF